MNGDDLSASRRSFELGGLARANLRSGMSAFKGPTQKLCLVTSNAAAVRVSLISTQAPRCCASRFSVAGHSERAQNL